MLAITMGQGIRTDNQGQQDHTGFKKNIVQYIDTKQG